MNSYYPLKRFKRVPWRKAQRAGTVSGRVNSGCFQHPPIDRATRLTERSSWASMGQAGSTANCGCIESILTGSTKREQFLEQQCTELARQNELLRNRLEQSSRSVDAASPNLNLSRQSSGNHHRKSLSAYKSLGGSSGNLAAAAAPSTANLSSVAEGSPGGRADTAANRRRSERSSSKMEQGQLATLAVSGKNPRLVCSGRHARAS